MRPGSLSPLIDSLTTEQVTSFLLRKGWQVRKFPNPRLVVFEPPESLAIGLTLVMPSKTDLSDFPDRLRDGVALLSELYAKEPETVVHQIAHWDRDVIRIRLESPMQKEQLLPLGYASEMIVKYRDFVAFAAATEIEPRRFFPRVTHAGRKFAEACMFGHTFAGSFGLTIECPLGLSPQLSLSDESQPRPFKRAVTERIATAYMDMAAAAEQDNPDIIVDNHLAGFTGNMCDILLEMFEISEGRTVSQRMVWAPELRPPTRLEETEHPITLDRRSSKVLKAASESLHTVDEPEEVKTIVGRVTLLRSDMPPLDTGRQAESLHTIVILWEMQPGQFFRLHVELPADQYRHACDAHKNGRKIMVSGKPRKIGKYWVLQDPHDFSIV